jgi:hypothetical protein
MHLSILISILTALAAALPIQKNFLKCRRLTTSLQGAAANEQQELKDQFKEFEAEFDAMELCLGEKVEGVSKKVVRLNKRVEGLERKEV